MQQKSDTTLQDDTEIDRMGVKLPIKLVVVCWSGKATRATITDQQPEPLLQIRPFFL